MQKDTIKLKQAVDVAVSRGRQLIDLLMLRGRFVGELVHIDGTSEPLEGHNDITNIGKNTLLDVMFSDATQIASTDWAIGLISLSGYSALAAADTAASHAGWTEFTGYTQATRVAWGPGTPASQSITNASAAVFDINATGTVKGIFVISEDTKGGTTGTLWATGLFGSDVAVVSSDQLRITYTVSC